MLDVAESVPDAERAVTGGDLDFVRMRVPTTMARTNPITTSRGRVFMVSPTATAVSLRRDDSQQASACTPRSPIVPSPVAGQPAGRGARFLSAQSQRPARDSGVRELATIIERTIAFNNRVWILVTGFRPLLGSSRSTSRIQKKRAQEPASLEFPRVFRC